MARRTPFRFTFWKPAIQTELSRVRISDSTDLGLAIGLVIDSPCHSPIRLVVD